MCWSLPPCTVVSQLEFNDCGRLTQKPETEAIFSPALRSGALQCKGSPQARVRNAMTAILNHLNSARSKDQPSREIPTLKGLILFCIGLAWKRTSYFEVDAAEIVMRRVLKPCSSNCTDISMLTVYWKLSDTSVNNDSRYGKSQTILVSTLKSKPTTELAWVLWPSLLVCPALYLLPWGETVLGAAQAQEDRKVLGGYPTSGQDFPSWKSALERA